jgi:hypothetical protein
MQRRTTFGLRRALGALLVLGVLAGSAAAFAPSSAGSGVARPAGSAGSGVVAPTFTLLATDPMKVSRVSFKLSSVAAPASVRVSMGSGLAACSRNGAASYTCSFKRGGEPMAAAANTLRVVTAS